MSRPPIRKRPSRVMRWEGLVEDVDGDQFCARLLPVHREGVELWADFPLDRLPSAKPGVLFNLYVHRRGRKFRTVLRQRDLGAWTAEELEAIRAEAQRLCAKIRQVTS